MTTNPDLNQAREWAAEITESRQTNIRPDAFAAAEVIASLPDEWIDADNLREALYWRASKPSGDDYDGEFYDRLRDLLPGPSLPDPLFGARATHPEYGEGIVASHHPHMDGEVFFMFPDEVTADGTNYQWVGHSTLTFHTQETPKFLETEEDYRNAPEGTIVAEDDAVPVVLLLDDLWGYVDTCRSDHEGMAGIRRRVLRWRWEA